MDHFLSVLYGGGPCRLNCDDWYPPGSAVSFQDQYFHDVQVAIGAIIVTAIVVLCFVFRGQLEKYTIGLMMLLAFIGGLLIGLGIPIN